jgi:alkylhydroperoxidase family enzyme
MEPQPIDASGDDELEGIFQHFVGTLGMVPTSLLTMQRVPALAKATVAMNKAVFAPDGLVDLGFKRLVGHMASAAAGCQYCKAHTTLSATRHGVDDEKMAAIYEFRTSDRFTEKERTALEFALAAGSVPNGVTDEIYDAMAAHWSEEEITEILGVVCMFGVFNRWNDSIATTLEDHAIDVTEPLLGDKGWEIGKHT